MSAPRLATRHHPALVVLHWLTGAMLVLALLMGTFALAPMPLQAPEKIAALRGHMVFGVLLGALMLVRLVVHLRTVGAVAPTPSSGNAAKDALARRVHVALYVLVFAQVASGLATAWMADLPSVVFGAGGVAIADNLRALAPRIAHGWIAKGIALLVLLHIAGALARHFIHKDGTLGRIWFGKRY